MEAVFKNIGIMAVGLVFLVSVGKWFEASRDKKITVALLRESKTDDVEAIARVRQILEEEKDAVSRWRIVAVVTGGLLALAYKAGL
jgi:hypothetical protein